MAASMSGARSEAFFATGEVTQLVKGSYAKGACGRPFAARNARWVKRDWLVRSTLAWLGLDEIPKPANLVTRGGVWFRCGALQVHLGVEEGFRPAKKAHPTFVVDDLSGFAKSLAEGGFAVRPEADQVTGGMRLFTEDPFGNRIELVQLHQPITP